MRVRPSVLLLVAVLLAPAAVASPLDGCPTDAFPLVPATVCKAHTGTTTCPGSGSESLFVGQGATGVGESDGGSCDSNGQRAAAVYVTVYVGGAPESFRWSSGHPNDPREITVSAAGASVDWAGAATGPCWIQVSGPVNDVEDCRPAPPPALPGLGYGGLIP